MLYVLIMYSFVFMYFNRFISSGSVCCRLTAANRIGVFGVLTRDTVHGEGEGFWNSNWEGEKMPRCHCPFGAGLYTSRDRRRTPVVSRSRVVGPTVFPDDNYVVSRGTFLHRTRRYVRMHTPMCVSAERRKGDMCAQNIIIMYI